MHGKSRERHSADAKREDAPERGKTQSEARIGQCTNHQHAHALRGKDEETEQTDHGEPTTMAGKVEIAIEISPQSPCHGEEQGGLRDEFAVERLPRHATSVHQHGTSVGFLDFLSDGKHRDEENHQREHAGNEDIREINVVVERRISDGVRIHRHRLEESHRLIVGGSFGNEHRARGSSRSQFAHGAHIFIEQRTCHEEGVVGVERHLGLFLSEKLFGGSLGEIVKSIDFSSLHSMSRLSHVGKSSGDTRVLEGIKIACDVARSGGVVLIHNSHRHFCGQSFSHERGKHHRTHQGHDKDAKEIDGT